MAQSGLGVQKSRRDDVPQRRPLARFQSGEDERQCSHTAEYHSDDGSRCFQWSNVGMLSVCYPQ